MSTPRHSLCDTVGRCVEGAGCSGRQCFKSRGLHQLSTTSTHTISAAEAPAVNLRASEAHAVLLWFDALLELNPSEVSRQDIELASSLYLRAGFRVPASIERALATTHEVEKGPPK